MAVNFFDSSALVKRHVDETGGVWRVCPENGIVWHRSRHIL